MDVVFCKAFHRATSYYARGAITIATRLTRGRFIGAFIDRSVSVVAVDNGSAYVAPMVKPPIMLLLDASGPFPRTPRKTRQTH